MSRVLSPAADAEVPRDLHEVASHSDGAVDDSYSVDRRARLRRSRLVGFALSVPVWLLSVVPLAREFTDGRDGAGIALVFVATAAFSIAVAAAIRGVYVLAMRRRFWSPWLFLLAALVAIVGYTVQSAGEEAVPLQSGAPAGELRDATD
jgi:cation transport ATPase